MPSCLKTHLPFVPQYLRQWIGSALVQIMACRPFGDNPLFKPILGYYQLNPYAPVPLAGDATALVRRTKKWTDTQQHRRDGLVEHLRSYYFACVAYQLRINGAWVTPMRRIWRMNGDATAFGVAYENLAIHSGETDEANCSWLHPVWPPPKRPDQDSTICVESRTSTELIFCIHRDFDVGNNVYKPRRLVCQCCRDISAWKSRVMKPTVLRDPGRMMSTEYRDEANWFSNWTDEANCW